MPRGISRHRGAEKQTILDLDTRTITALAADTDDWADLLVGAAFAIGCTGADRTVKGIAGGREGRTIELINVLGYNVFLQNEATSSVAGNRILTGMPSNASFQIPPNGAVFLTYNNTVNRWVVAHGNVNYYPETDANVAVLFRNKKPNRAGGMMTQGTFLQLLGTSQGFLKPKFTAKTSGDIGNQAFGVVSGAQVSFTMPAAGDVIVAVHATSKSGTPGAVVAIASAIGVRFDSDTALVLNSVDMVNGGGSDYINAFPLFGVWGKSLAAGAHTADLCWGDSSGNYGMYADASHPAVIAVLYPG
jgi:hypothetical protein